jgi:hypothetical protein
MILFVNGFGFMPQIPTKNKNINFRGNSSSFAFGKTTVPPKVALMPFGSHTKTRQ